MRIYILLFFAVGFSIHAQAQTNSDSSNTGEVFTYIETAPQFPGGDVAFNTFIKENLIYPKEAKRNHVTGTVIVSFYIETDGSLSDVQVVPGKGLYPPCDQAALDVVAKSPKWNPGKINGVSVKTKQIARVKFELK